MNWSAARQRWNPNRFAKAQAQALAREQQYKNSAVTLNLSDREIAYQISQLTGRPVSLAEAGTFQTNGLIAATPFNPGYFINELQNMNGGILKNGSSNGTFSIAAAKSGREVGWSNLGSSIRSISTGNNEYPMYRNYRFVIECSSNNFFNIQPWILLMENGEVYSDSDTTDDDIAVAVGTGIPAQDYSISYGPIYYGHPDGNGYVRTNLSFDLTSIMNAYSEHYARCELEEKNYLELILGFHIKGTASQTISYFAWVLEGYVQVSRRVLGGI